MLLSILGTHSKPFELCGDLSSEMLPEAVPLDESLWKKTTS
jgi:hypothetical protein